MRTRGVAGGRPAAAWWGPRRGSTGAAGPSSLRRRRGGTSGTDGDVGGSSRERAASHSSGDGGGAAGGGDIGKAVVGGTAGGDLRARRAARRGSGSSWRASELQSGGPAVRLLLGRFGRAPEHGRPGCGRRRLPRGRGQRRRPTAATRPPGRSSTGARRYGVGSAVGTGGRGPARSTRTCSKCWVSRGSSSRTAGQPPVSSRGGTSSAQRCSSARPPGRAGSGRPAAGWPGCA